MSYWINNVCSFLSMASEWLKTNSALVTAIATVVLAIITLFYLLETRRQRLLTEKVVWVETSPKVFIKTITPTVKAYYDKNELVVNTNILFTNCGKIEAKNFAWSYKIKQGSQEVIHDTHLFLPYIYPEQLITTSIHKFIIPLSPEQMAIVKQAHELKQSINISNIEPAFLDIKFEYDDLDEKRTSRQDQYKYSILTNQWIILGQSTGED